MLKWRFVVGAFVGLSCFCGVARADVEFLWGLTGAAGVASDLYAINPTTGQVIGKIGSTGQDNLAGIARHPVTGVLYATQGQMSDKQLMTIDPFTGRATPVGTVGFGVSDLAFRSNGVLYGLFAPNRNLVTINTATGTSNLILANATAIGTVGMTFGLAGQFYMTRSNSIATVNPDTGAVIGAAVVITGAATSVDNILATSSSGVLYTAARNGKIAPTNLYTINPTTGTTAFVSTLPDIALSGIEFGTAGPPTLKIDGSKRIKTKKKKVKIKGAAQSFLPLTVQAKGAKEAAVVDSKWTLNVTLKRSKKSRITITTSDAFGQSVSSRVTVIRVP